MKKLREEKKTVKYREMCTYISNSSHAPSFNCIAFAIGSLCIILLNCFYLDHQVVHFLRRFSSKGNALIPFQSLSHFYQTGIAHQIDWELISKLIAIYIHIYYLKKKIVFFSHIVVVKKECINSRF